jgi:hypothetical protein
LELEKRIDWSGKKGLIRVRREDCLKLKEKIDLSGGKRGLIEVERDDWFEWINWNWRRGLI